MILVVGVVMGHPPVLGDSSGSRYLFCLAKVQLLCLCYAAKNDFVLSRLAASCYARRCLPFVLHSGRLIVLAVVVTRQRRLRFIRPAQEGKLRVGESENANRGGKSRQLQLQTVAQGWLVQACRSHCWANQQWHPVWPPDGNLKKIRPSWQSGPRLPRRRRKTPYDRDMRPRMTFMRAAPDVVPLCGSAGPC